MESFHISFSLSACLDLSASVPAALLLIPSPRSAPASPSCLLAAAAAVWSFCSRPASCQFKMIYTLSASPVCYFNQPHQISDNLNPGAVTVHGVEVSGCSLLALHVCARASARVCVSPVLLQLLGCCGGQQGDSC